MREDFWRPDVTRLNWQCLKRRWVLVWACALCASCEQVLSPKGPFLMSLSLERKEQTWVKPLTQLT